MGLTNKSKQQRALRDQRRAWVSRLTLRGRTLREIAEDLAEKGISVNPDTGEAWTHATIGNDLQALRKQWREDATQSITEHQSLMIAELEEVRRRAWSDGNMPVVLRALQQKAKLLGLDAPTKHAILDWRREAQEIGLDPAAVFERHLEDAAAAIAEGVGEPEGGSVGGSLQAIH